MSEPIDYSLHILPICLPKDNKLLVDKTAWTKGLGRVEFSGVLPNVLQEISIAIISNNECKERTSKKIPNMQIPNAIICHINR